MRNNITKLFNIKYPIIQGGMIWCSGYELVSAVSNAGGLGLIGSGSMYPDVLQDHIRKTHTHTSKPFGVNIPLLSPYTQELIKIIIQEGVKIVFTSAGNPKKWTAKLKRNNITVVHVISNSKFALKSEEAGVDALVAEGFEAGGHNGREETTSLCLIPLIKKYTQLPLIAAGGFYSGESLLAANILGADGIQIGSRFAISKESSSHINFKKSVIEAKEGDTKLMLKKLTPVRLLKNKFSEQVQIAEDTGKNQEELQELLGKERAKKGIFSGNLDAGELEIGQTATFINKIETAKSIIQSIVKEYNQALLSTNTYHSF